MRYFKKNYTTPIKHVSKFTNSALLRKINIIRYYKRPSGVVNSNHSSLSINVLKLLYKTLFFLSLLKHFRNSFSSDMNRHSIVTKRPNKFMKPLLTRNCLLTSDGSEAIRIKDQNLCISP